MVMIKLFLELGDNLRIVGIAGNAKLLEKLRYNAII